MILDIVQSIVVHYLEDGLPYEKVRKSQVPLHIQACECQDTISPTKIGMPDLASERQRSSFVFWWELPPQNTHVWLCALLSLGHTEMSTFNPLRRRVLGDSASEPSRTSSPNPAARAGEPVTLVPASKLEKLTKERSKKRQWLVFGLGGLFGIIFAALFAQQQNVINLEGLMDINLDTLLDAIPAGFVNDAKDITVCAGFTSACSVTTG